VPATEGVGLGSCMTDIVEIATLRGRAPNFNTIANRQGLRLPEFGRVLASPEQIALSVRPDRWLLLSPPGPPGASAETWQAACAGCAVAVDLSSGLVAFHLEGPAVHEVLARGCRLDLDPEVFPAGSAAATVMAQVSVAVMALSSGVLLLTPATTARHFYEWLASAAKPFGFVAKHTLPFSKLAGDRVP
jgi:heterotetrameric sarcosine oxidase gamma subunit